LADVEDLLFGAEGGAYAGGSANTGLRGITEAPICLSIVVRIKNEGGTGGGPSKTVGIAYLDSVDRKIGLSEFVENDIYSNTEVRWTLLFYYLDSPMCPRTDDSSYVFLVPPHPARHKRSRPPRAGQDDTDRRVETTQAD
jgi:hypothetical protein